MSERARGGETDRTRATRNENERLRRLRDCTGWSWRPHSFWSNLGAVRAFPLRHRPGGEKSTRIQAEALPTCVRPGRCDCESAVGRGNISRSLPGVRGIRFELELELWLLSTRTVTGGPNPHLYGQVQAQVQIKTGSFELTFCWKKPEKFLVPHGQIRPCVKWGV